MRQPNAAGVAADRSGQQVIIPGPVLDLGSEQRGE